MLPNEEINEEKIESLIQNSLLRVTLVAIDIAYPEFWDDFDDSKEAESKRPEYKPQDHHKILARYNDHPHKTKSRD